MNACCMDSRPTYYSAHYSQVAVNIYGLMASDVVSTIHVTLLETA